HPPGRLLGTLALMPRFALVLDGLENETSRSGSSQKSSQFVAQDARSPFYTKRKILELIGNFTGGAGADRTRDLLNATRAVTPSSSGAIRRWRRSGVELNRPRQVMARSSL